MAYFDPDTSDEHGWSLSEAEKLRDWECTICGALWCLEAPEQPGDKLHPHCEHEDKIEISACCGAPINLETRTCSQCRDYA